MDCAGSERRLESKIPKLCRPNRRPRYKSAYSMELALYPHGSVPPVISPLKRQVEPLARCRFRAGRRRCGTWADPRRCTHSIHGGATRWPGARMRQVFLSLFPLPAPLCLLCTGKQVRPWGLVPSLCRAGAQGTHLARKLCGPFLTCSHPGPYTPSGPGIPTSESYPSRVPVTSNRASLAPSWVSRGGRVPWSRQKSDPIVLIFTCRDPVLNRRS